MKIQKQLIVDYACVSLAYVTMIIALHPVYFGKFEVTEELITLLASESVLAFCVALIVELFVTYILRKPFSYSDEMNVRFRHFVLSAIVAIPLSAAFLNQFLVLWKFGWGNWHYAWLDYDGAFTLKWYLNVLLPCVVAVAFIFLFAMPVISQIRVMFISINELKEMNQLLESEQTMLRSRPINDDVTDKIILNGDSRESLAVNPLDIMYVESVGNYLNIVYFNDSELCQKRLRSSLKEIEDALEVFPFMVHTHRAFLVNINFITQVSGNAAGYKISLFSTERVLPVSKANVGLFRDKIKELGKNIN